MMKVKSCNVIQTWEFVAGIAATMVELGISGTPNMTIRFSPAALILKIQEITVSRYNKCKKT